MLVGCNFLPHFPFLRIHPPRCKQGGTVVVVVGVGVAVVGVAGDAGVVIAVVVVAAIGLALVVIVADVGFLRLRFSFLASCGPKMVRRLAAIVGNL